jgi:DNA-binding NtrC family response regulator
VYIVKEGCPVQPWPEELLERYHIFVRSFATAADCLAALQECPCALLVVSLDGGPEAGLRLLTQAGQLHPLMFSIAVVHIGDVHMAVRAMKAGRTTVWKSRSRANGGSWRLKRPQQNGKGRIGTRMGL